MVVFDLSDAVTYLFVLKSNAPAKPAQYLYYEHAPRLRRRTEISGLAVSQTPLVGTFFFI